MMTDKSNQGWPNNSDDPFRLTTWRQKFAVAGRGIRVAIGEEKSFIFHFIVSGLVILAGFVLGIMRWEWCIIVVAIMAGLSTELLNTAIERLSKAITEDYNPHVRDSLDIASGAVSVIAFGAVVLAFLVIGSALMRNVLIPWWTSGAAL